MSLLSKMSWIFGGGKVSKKPWYYEDPDKSEFEATAVIDEVQRGYQDTVFSQTHVNETGFEDTVVSSPE